MKAVLRLVLTAVLGWFCGTAVLNAQATSLNVFASGPSGFLLDYAQQFGYFDAEGVVVRHVYAEKDKRRQGRTAADAYIAGTGGAANLYMNGGDTLVLAQLFTSLDYYGVSRYAPSDAARIGKAAAGASAGEPYLSLKAMLKYLGAGGAKVNPSRLDDSAKYKLLEDGGADLVMISSQTLVSLARASGKYYVVEPSDAYKGKGLFTAVLSNSKAVKAKGPELEKFLAALRSALADAVANTPQFVALMESGYGFTEAEALSYHADLATAVAAAPFTPSQSDLDLLLPEINISTASKRKRAGLGGITSPDYAVKAKGHAITHPKAAIK